MPDFGCVTCMGECVCFTESGDFMHIHIAGRRRGSTLAFLLMALIAILALVVVFLSRAGRDDKQTANPAAEVSAPVAATQTNQTTDTATAGVSQTPAPGIIIPPPPPLLTTPDTRDLPPEG